MQIKVKQKSFNANHLHLQINCIYFANTTTKLLLVLLLVRIKQISII